MKKIKNKKIVLFIILLLVISSTIAFLYTTDTFQNIFVAGSYKVVMTEEFVSPDNWTPGDITPKTVTLKNEGTVPIKVRVKLEEEWKDSNDNNLPLEHDGENVAIINFTSGDNYILKDGYYYYDSVLNPGETASSIIESVTFNPNYSGTVTCEYLDEHTQSCSSSDEGYEGGIYKLTITLEGVQEDYYVQAWGLSGLIEKPTLYNILRNESDTNGLAREYTGHNQDSYTENASKKIYHYYASTDSEGTQVLDKNNVVFGGQCWQMIRTTDTGGVKMIYNGEADNNQCLNTRGTHVGYVSRTSQTLSSDYWYGTDYLYDSINKTFQVSGVTEQATWNETSGPTLIGKYTCKSSGVNDSCSVLYLVESYRNPTAAFVLSIDSNSLYSQFGTLQFNNNDSLSDVGYKYGDVYQSFFNFNIGLNGTVTFTSTDNNSFILSSSTLNTNFWYADSISFDSSTNMYSLVNAYQINSENEYSNLVGKYTFRNTSEHYSDLNVNYIAGVNNSTMYYKYLSNGKLLSDYEPMIFGDSFLINNDGSYKITNMTSVSLRDWVNNYSNYRGKYMCIGSESNMCSRVLYISSVAITNYYYWEIDPILVGKSFAGTTLIDTILVDKRVYYSNFDDEYNEYVYTCLSKNAVCTDKTLLKITDGNNTSYSYEKNYYYGTDVTWDGLKYTLVNPISSFSVSNNGGLTSINNYHFTCGTVGEKTCQEVKYYLSSSSSLTLKSGETSISKIMEDMLEKNTNNSIIKSGIDAWYKHFMLEYDEFIEDTIFCNDRSIRSLGGWNPLGGNLNENLEFKEYKETKKLNCSNSVDQFSVSNPSARLDFKVGLLSSPEVDILGNIYVKKTGSSYWLGSPSFFPGIAQGRVVNENGSTVNNSLYKSNGVRPAISIKPGIEYSSGDGSMANPYIVKTE